MITSPRFIARSSTGTGSKDTMEESANSKYIDLNSSPRREKQNHRAMDKQTDPNSVFIEHPISNIKNKHRKHERSFKNRFADISKRYTQVGSLDVDAKVFDRIIADADSINIHHIEYRSCFFLPILFLSFFFSSLHVRGLVNTPMLTKKRRTTTARCNTFRPMSQTDVQLRCLT